MNHIHRHKHKALETKLNIVLNRQVPIHYKLDIEIEWSGSGVDEKGYIKRCSGKYKVKEGSEVVCVDPRYFRPTEVDLLIGDPTKAKEKLKWQPKYDLYKLIDDMIDSDLKLMQKDKYLDDGGYKIMHYFE